MNFYFLLRVLLDNTHCKNRSFGFILAYAFYLRPYKYSIYKNHFSDKIDNIYCVLTNK